MNKIILLLILILPFSVGIRNHHPFLNPSAMGWYLSFTQKYKIPTLVQKRKVIIAIIDSGYNSPFLTEKYIANENGFNVSHGTHITGIIYAINPDAEIISYNVFKKDATEIEIINQTALAIRKAIKEKVDLINISMSGVETSIEEIEAIEEAQKQGIVILVAAGNDNQELSYLDCTSYPACHKRYFNNIIVVGNILNTEFKAKRSNYGKILDVSFNGVMVESLDPELGFAYQSGTSQATAFITGLLSLSISNQEKKLSIPEIKELLMKKTGLTQRKAGLMVAFKQTRGIASELE